MLKVILIVNWGLGLEILKTLDRMQNVRICNVITQFGNKTQDPWFNIVYDFVKEQEYEVIIQNKITFLEIRRLIIEQNADLLMVHSFMRKIPSEVFSAPKLGSINIHPSLLPKYRGPLPTYWVLKNNDTKTGLTCHIINEGFDTGDIINQMEVLVEKNDTTETIIEKQKKIVKPLLIQTLNLITNKNFKSKPQPTVGVSYAPRPKSG